MNKTAVAAILDVGKTNKKVSLYNSEFEELAIRKIQLDARDAGDGLEYEQTEELFDWTCRILAELSEDFDIRALSITTHGATLALLDGDGNLAHPIFSYLSPASEKIEEPFNTRFGPMDKVHAETCTPPFGFANAAKQILFLQTYFPQSWDKVKHLLFYPQYLGYLFTGQMATDPTFLGCHTYLWNPHESKLSEIAHELGVDDKIPSKVLPPWDQLGTISDSLGEKYKLPAGIPVTVGIHDSNASIVPYLAKGFHDFTLNSTGTWCVAMTPSDDLHFKESELGTKTFYSLSAYGNPVKTAIFPGGLEFGEFSDLAGRKDDAGHVVLEKLCLDQELFLTGGLVPGAEAFPNSKPAAYVGDRCIGIDELKEKGLAAVGIDSADFLAALNFSLAMQTVEVLNRSGRKDGSDIFIEGGFANNQQYCEILAALLPENRCNLTDLKEATAFGAALCAWKLLDNVELESLSSRFEIGIHTIVPVATTGLQEYAEKYLQLSGAS